MSEHIQGITGPVPNGPVRLTRQHVESWQKSMAACQLAVSADLMLREHARANPPRFSVARMNKLFEACVVAGYTGAHFTFKPAHELAPYADLRDVLFADDLVEKWARGRGVTVMRDADNLFIAHITHVTFGGTQAGLMVQRGFLTRMEAILYVLGQHPEAAVAHYPGSIEHYISKENFAEALMAQPAAVPAAPPEQVKLPEEFALAFGEEQVAELFKALIELAKAEGITDESLLEQLRKGQNLGHVFAKDMRQIQMKMTRDWPRLTQQQAAQLSGLVYPKLAENLRLMAQSLLQANEGYDPLAGGLPPGCEPSGNDWDPPKQD